MKAWLSFLLPQKLEIDTREPIFLWEPFDTTYGLYVPSVAFWLEIVWVLAFQCIISVLISLVAYKFIIDRRGTVTSYLVGYGVIIPFCLLFPVYEVVVMDIRNKIMKTLLGLVSTLALFHTTEAMYGCEPEHVSGSAGAFALYWGSPGVLMYEPKSRKLVKSSIYDTLRHLRRFAVDLCITGALMSYMEPSHFQPFPQPDGEWYDLRRVLDFGQLRNNLLTFLLFQMYLTTMTEGLLAVNVTVFRCKTEVAMDNPAIESKSPSDFWSKRWNRLFHGVLKRGAYLPVRKYFPKLVAVSAAFLASGLFHEWIHMACMLLPLDYELDSAGMCTPPRCLKPTSMAGSSMAFFIWNGALVAIDYAVGNWLLFRWMAKTLPKPVRAFLVILTGTPLAHWFADAYIKSSFFAHGQIGFPLILPVPSGPE